MKKDWRKDCIRDRNFYAQQSEEMSIYDIEDHVYYSLIKYIKSYNCKELMKIMKAVQTFKRLKNTTDESILGLLDKDKFRCYK